MFWSLDSGVLLDSGRFLDGWLDLYENSVELSAPSFPLYTWFKSIETSTSLPNSYLLTFDILQSHMVIGCLSARIHLWRDVQVRIVGMVSRKQGCCVLNQSH